MRSQVVRSRRKVPQEALPQHPQQEFVAVLALVPAHAIRELSLGIPDFTGPAGRPSTEQVKFQVQLQHQLTCRRDIMTD